MQSTTTPPRLFPCHVRLARTKEEVIVGMWESPPGPDLDIPAALLFAADWVFDIERRHVIKNSTGRPFLVSLGVPEVGREWLFANGFVRQRRAT